MEENTFEESNLLGGHFFEKRKKALGHFTIYHASNFRFVFFSGESAN